MSWHSQTWVSTEIFFNVFWWNVYNFLTKRCMLRLKKPTMTLEILVPNVETLFKTVKILSRPNFYSFKTFIWVLYWTRVWPHCFFLFSRFLRNGKGSAATCCWSDTVWLNWEWFWRILYELKNGNLGSLGCLFRQCGAGLSEKVMNVRLRKN